MTRLYHVAGGNALRVLGQTLHSPHRGGHAHPGQPSPAAPSVRRVSCVKGADVDEQERHLAAQLSTIDTDLTSLQVSAQRLAIARATHDVVTYRVLRKGGLPRLAAAAVTFARAMSDHVCGQHDDGCWAED